MKFEQNKKRLDSPNLSVEKHSQIIHFDNRTKLTIPDVVEIWTNTYLHIKTMDGAEYIINQDKILFSEVTYEK